MYRVWLDDVRPPPENGNWDMWVKTGERCIELLDEDKVGAISFDHDMGTPVTGYVVSLHIERGRYNGKFGYPIYWEIHSMNPVGAKNIRKSMENADRFLKRWSK